MERFILPMKTTKEQSARLIALGVKPETADVRDNFPAWSLSRLIDMMPISISNGVKKANLFISHVDVSYLSLQNNLQIFFLCGFVQDKDENLFDAIIDMIEWLIEQAHFDKENLKNEITGRK